MRELTRKELEMVAGGITGGNGGPGGAGGNGGNNINFGQGGTGILATGGAGTGLVNNQGIVLQTANGGKGGKGGTGGAGFVLVI